ncbi:CatB-related O-acetyltransferase [Nocardia sp. NBC_01327]|uniref:CatB-related O-acetyltransferase n=1 Tax=Nocardia sp. NBC_01327 TaxID=2903593 RepID=UPI002E16667E|nr:CatB-related O-acetyltransferase [Nocardia sp. NBC_01327]
MVTVIPDPSTPFPLPHTDRTVYLKPHITSASIEVGDYSYFDDPVAATEFEANNVLYAFGPEKLIIGKFCALATGTRFIMAGANHATAGVSTFPFTIFGGTWAEQTMDIITSIPSKGDTVVGNDVWFGYNSLIMPGVRIGDGAIIATGSVVTADVPPYTIVGGNPAKPVKQRFDDAEVDLLLRAAWWNWPIELVTEHVRVIMAGTPKEIGQIARENGLLAD